MVRRRIRGVVDVERRVGWQTTDVLTTEIYGGREKNIRKILYTFLISVFQIIKRYRGSK